MKYYAILVGGGSGSRMKTDLPKQFLEIEGLPVLGHTLQAFEQSRFQPEIIVVLNIHYHQTWELLCKQYQITVPHTLVKGGNTRFDSVKNGLKSIKGKGIVAIHDAVRPLVSAKLIDSAFGEAEISGSAIPGIKSKDSIRRLTATGSEAVNREDFILIQTPQVFQSDILRKAYQQPFRDQFTDDASVVQRAGFEINLIEGEDENLKITYPLDLELAKILLQKKIRP